MSGAGEVRAATGGNNDCELLPGVSDDGTPKDFSKGLGSSRNRLLLWEEK